jgi:hypothetical protein
MTTSDWISFSGVLVVSLGGIYAIIMTAVDRKIGIAIGKIRDERLQELIAENHRKEERIEQLKDRIKDMK